MTSGDGGIARTRSRSCPKQAKNRLQTLAELRVYASVGYPVRSGHLVLCKPEMLCYTLPARERLFRLFLGSSAVEHSTVNRMVAGSNPARGASSLLFAC